MELSWELREHLREACAEKDGKPKMFVVLNGHKCEKCAAIIRQCVEEA